MLYIENFRNKICLNQICSYGIFLGTQERVRNSRGKQAIGVRTTKICTLDLTGRISWVTHVKHLLFKYGFRYVWIAREDGDDLNFYAPVTNVRGHYVLPLSFCPSVCLSHLKRCV